MKRINFKCLPVLLLLWSAPVVRGQEGSFSPLPHTEKLEKQLEVYASELRTLSADFTQVKEMKMLQDEITSRGRFFYKAAEKIRIEYTSPFKYLMVLNGGRMFIRDGDKVQKINSGNSGLMQTVNRLLLDCMRGKPFENPDFTVSALQSETLYKLLLVPRESSRKDLFSRIEILLDKTALHVTRLTLVERNGDATRMSFKNSKRNAPVSDALFGMP